MKLRRDGQLGEARRAHLLNLLKDSQLPVKAADLAKNTGVSRQVIVQDIALLRARREPLMATPQGYLYLPAQVQIEGVRTIIFSCHTYADTETELNIMVDHGVTVIDVGIEHSVYARNIRPLGLKNRMDVKTFLQQMAASDASLLSSLTGGLHFHTLEASRQEIIEQARQELASRGFIAE